MELESHHLATIRVLTDSVKKDQRSARSAAQVLKLGQYTDQHGPRARMTRKSMKCFMRLNTCIYNNNKSELPMDSKMSG